MQVFGFKVLSVEQIKALIKKLNGASFKYGDDNYVYLCHKPSFVLDTIEEVKDDNDVVWYYLEIKAVSTINKMIYFKSCWIKQNEFDYFLKHDVKFHVATGGYVVLEDIGNTTLKDI